MNQIDHHDRLKKYYIDNQVTYPLSSEAKGNFDYFLGTAMGILPEDLVRSRIKDLSKEFVQSVDEGLIFLNENNEEQTSGFRQALCKIRDQDLEYIENL